MSSKRLFSMGLGRDLLATLTRNGYQTQKDVLSNFDNADALAKGLKIPLADAQDLFIRCQPNSTPVSTLQMSQSVAGLVQQIQRISTKSASVDSILDGGLPRGSILEISGPPGSPKVKLAADIVSSFTGNGDEAIFIECHNAHSPATLSSLLKDTTGTPEDLSKRVHYSRLSVLADLLLFLYQLPVFLQLHPSVSLLTISSISSPFQDPELSIQQKGQLLEKFRQTLLKITSMHNLTVVLTSQLATKMINADGTPGTFESGARGVMLPQLGPGYLPTRKSYRIMFTTDGLGSGFIRLLSSPKYPPGKAPSIISPYTMVGGNIQ